MSELNLLRKAKGVSPVWDYFGFEADETGHKEITKSVTQYIAGESIPIYTLEKHYFREMLKTLDSRYNLPSRKYLALKPEKLACITTDNGSNILRAVDTILAWPRISCFGHNLNLAVTNSYKGDVKVSRALSICRTIVSSFSYSWKRRRQLTRFQNELSLPNHQLITDCCTRWGSAHAMLKRFLEQETAIRKVLSDDRKCSHLIPRYTDIQVLEAIKFTFDPVADLSAEKYVTFSAVQPLLKLLETTILDTTDDAQAMTSRLKEKIQNYLSKKYSDIAAQELTSFATYVGPRFKTDCLSAAECTRMRKRITTREEYFSVLHSVREKCPIADQEKTIFEI